MDIFCGIVMIWGTDSLTVVQGVILTQCIAAICTVLYQRRPLMHNKRRCRRAIGMVLLLTYTPMHNKGGVTFYGVMHQNLVTISNCYISMLYVNSWPMIIHIWFIICSHFLRFHFFLVCVCWGGGGGGGGGMGGVKNLLIEYKTYWGRMVRMCNRTLR